MSNREPTQTANYKALEKFVVHNDELLQLEERIGRFNIFDALGIVNAEIRHSNFLAWLLDPNESHGQGPLFLKAFLMDLLRQSPPKLRPLNPVEIDGAELRGVEIRREWHHIDILITCEEPKFVIAIENKINAGKYNPFKAYEDRVKSEFPGKPTMFVLLTVDGSELEDFAWVPYQYENIHSVLTRIRKANATSIGDDVLAFLDHYIRLIGSRFMNDPKIDELCQTIYQNHRQALDLIYQRVGSPTSGILSDMYDVIASDNDKWHIFNRTSLRIDFIPTDWLDWIPPLCARPKWPPQMWIRWWLHCHTKGCAIIIEIGPCTETTLRNQVINRLIHSPKEFGMKVTRNQATGMYTRLKREFIAKWAEGEEPETEAVLSVLQKKLNSLHANTKGIADALRPIIDAWEKNK